MSEQICLHFSWWQIVYLVFPKKLTSKLSSETWKFVLRCRWDSFVRYFDWRQWVNAERRSFRQHFSLPISRVCWRYQTMYSTLFLMPQKYISPFSTRKRALFLVLARKEQREKNMEKKVIYYSHRQLEKFYFYLTILWRHRAVADSLRPPQFSRSEAFRCLKRFVWWKKTLAAHKSQSEKGGEKITNFVFSAHGKTPTEVSIKVESVMCRGNSGWKIFVLFFRQIFPVQGFFLSSYFRCLNPLSGWLRAAARNFLQRRKELRVFSEENFRWER